MLDGTGDCKGLPSWRTGRRIVELGHLADQMICEKCDSLLILADITNEIKYGLASYFEVKCRQCLSNRIISTGKKHVVPQGERSRCFDINTKMAAAMLNAGVGETQIADILAELNTPSPSSTTMKKREREIGCTNEEFAQQSCSEAVDQENEAIADTRYTGAKVIIDGGWQKQGSGRARDSMSGHLVVIGSKSKKCLNFGVANKNCRVCKSATKKRNITRLHDYRKNFNGSSNAMESFLAVRTLQKVQDNGLRVTEVVMDDDSTTLSKLKKHT